MNQTNETKFLNGLIWLLGALFVALIISFLLTGCCKCDDPVPQIDEICLTCSYDVRYQTDSLYVGTHYDEDTCVFVGQEADLIFPNEQYFYPDSLTTIRRVCKFKPQ